VWQAAPPAERGAGAVKRPGVLRSAYSCFGCAGYGAPRDTPQRLAHRLAQAWQEDGSAGKAWRHLPAALRKRHDSRHGERPIPAAIGSIPLALEKCAPADSLGTRHDRAGKRSAHSHQPHRGGVFMPERERGQRMPVPCPQAKRCMTPTVSAPSPRNLNNVRYWTLLKSLWTVADKRMLF
jgi:hypothetical protein